MNDIPFPFEGMSKKVKEKKPKIIKRGKIKCTCGALAKVWTAMPSFHDYDCIINKKRK